MRDIPDKTLRIHIRHAVCCLAVAVTLLAFLSSAALSKVIDGIAIVVNKDAILVSEINEAMMPLMQEYRTKYSGEELKKKIDELRQTVIDQAIETKLILQVAKAKNIKADEKDVDARLEVVKKRFPSEDVFLQALAARGLTIREYRDQVAEQVLVQTTIKQVLGSEIRVSDNEIQTYYDGHPDEFITEQQIQLAQIFLKIPSGSTLEEIDQLRQKAEQLRILIDDGVDFSELARKYSEGPYRDKGGMVGLVGAKDILPELKDIAFSLKAGEVSPVIQTSYGLHILKAIDTMPAHKITLKEATPNIEERLSETKRNEKYKTWIKKLRQDAFVDVKI